jgi:hypothetical protein
MLRILPFKIAITKLNDNLYLGSIEDASNYKKLKTLGITHILNVATEIPNFFEPHFIYKKISAQDTPKFQLSKYFDEIADFINEGATNGKVFVHCFCGISRSTTSILAYFIKHRNQDFVKTLEFIKKKRWIVCPNDGFLRQLRAFQAIHIKQDQKENVDKRPTETKFTIKNSRQLRLGYEEPVKKAEQLKVKSQSVSKSKLFTITRTSKNQKIGGNSLIPRTTIY